VNTENTRFTLSIPKEMAEKVDTLKKDYFYDKPYSEMFRQFIQIGIENFDSQEKPKVL
jgi:metal-responsive CopG/Arc/MetJ family transcriptional regulator